MRIQLDVSRETKEVIERAAAIDKVSVTEFIIMYAEINAELIVRRHERQQEKL